MDHFQDQSNLHLAALSGDDDGVHRAIEAGADVNALDNTGRTALMCAVAGEHWQNIDASDASFMTPKRLNAIRLLLGHPCISLFTLNAPQNSTNGVVPLGMAAWLNMQEAVRLLLEGSAAAVSVDGMDTHGATALMYAARDGGLNVVQLLLSHGARPDFRDHNYRSSIQFSLKHPQILWLCESILRRHRWRESQSADRNKLFPGCEALLDLARAAMPSDSLEPPPVSIFNTRAISRLTDTLISSIMSSEVSFLYSLLFSPAIPSSSPAALYPMSAPVLVNQPDSVGWSPIHYCVSVPLPCIDVLDALYCAGAEVALFTTHEHFTPLHVLAQSVQLPSDDPEEHAESLYHFTVHLIRDLRAPLSARDKNDETCIHLAAEHGYCIELLAFFLEFDTTGSVRELRNSRGLTALEVAKPEFIVAFGENVEKYRSASSLSTHTIRAISSFASLVSLSDGTPAVHDDCSSLCTPLDLDFQESTQRLLFNLRSTSNCVDNDPDSIEHLTNLVAEASQLSHGIISQSRRRVREANQALSDLRGIAVKTHTLLDSVTSAAVEKLGERGFDTFPRRNRGSEDSQITVLNRSSRNASTSSIAKGDQVDDTHVSVAIQTVLITSPSQSPSRSVSWTERLDGVIARPAGSCVYDTCISNFAEVERDLAIHKRKMLAADSDWNELASPGMDVKLKQLMKKHKKMERELEATEKKMEKASVSIFATSKLKAWIKRIFAPGRPITSLKMVYDLEEQGCAVGRQVKSDQDPTSFVNDEEEEKDVMSDARIEHALRTAHVILNASKRDLRTIDECLEAADRFLDLANRSISRAEHVTKRAIKKREANLASLRRRPTDRSQDQGLGVGPQRILGHGLLSANPSVSSLASVYSSHSSCASVAATLMENDDDDTRALRRLLLRKIEAGVTGSWDEMDKVEGWLGIVREAVRGVKRRAYL